MSTIRAYNGENRIAAAVTLKSGEILQVYPRPEIRYTSWNDWKTALADQAASHTFESLEAWKATVKGATEYKTITRVPRRATKPRKSGAERYRDAQIMDFFDKEYNWMFKSLEVKKENGKPVIHVTLCNDSNWTLFPSETFFTPPRIFTEGREVTEFNNQYSPALTMVKWLMMLAFVKPVKM